MNTGKIKKTLIFLIISLFVLLVNHFPDYYAYIKTPEGMSFSGQASWFDPWDINVYVAAIKWGQNHGLLLQNVYTTTVNQPVLIYPLYTLTGLLLPQISPYLLFHALAIITGFILLFIIWKFSQVFLEKDTERVAALFLIALGGGVGWLFFPSIQSADLFMTGFTFSSHFQRAHEALGIGLYLLALIAFFPGTNQKKSKISLVAIISLSLLIIIYPYYLLSFGLIAGLYSLILYFQSGKTSPLKHFLLTLLPATIILIIYFIHLNSSTGFTGVLSQKLSSPNLFQILLGLGIFSPLIIYQLLKGWRSQASLYLFIWLFTSILLTFLPFGFSRFYLRSLFFPVVILALFAVNHISLKLKISIFLLFSILLIISPISSFYMSFKKIDEVTKSNQWFYLKDREREALTYLEKNTPENSKVLAGYALGNYIPANTNSRVYFGHLIQTPKSEEKIKNLTLFYSQKISSESAKQFLDRENIEYIYFGLDEKSISQQYNQKDKLEYEFLKPVFTNSEVTIYSIEHK